MVWAINRVHCRRLCRKSIEPDGGERPRPKIEFEVGEELRVTEGPFADFNAFVEEVNYERNKLLMPEILNYRSTQLMGFDQVEKIVLISGFRDEIKI